MIRKLHHSLPLYHFQLLEEFPEINHFVSTRDGGVSQGEFSSLNISYSTADSEENVTENRGRIAKAVGLPVEHLFFARQVHGSQILHIDAHFTRQIAKQQYEGLMGMDALITQCPEVCLCVTAADCVPLLFYDPKTKAIGAAHAGWRGTTQKIASKTIEAMKLAFGTDPSDIQVGIGPSISGEVYEVGPEVLEAVAAAMGDLNPLVSKQHPHTGKAHLDLWETNRRQLVAAGVKATHIEIGGHCTYTEQEVFFSARRFQGKGGRFCAGITLSKP